MSIEKKFTLNRLTVFILTLIGFIGAVITIYAFFAQQRNIELQYQITSNTNVLDIKAEVRQIDILFDGKSLKSSNENVRIITLKIANTGNTDILKNFYDEKDPLGFKINNGHLLKEPELLDASSDYIKRNLKISSDTTGNVYFSSIILETSEFFTIKLLIIHSLGVDPKISPVGKIAGIKEVILVNTIESQESESFFTKVFSGNLLTQIVRGFVYTLVVILIIVLIVFIGDKISDYRSKKKRENAVLEFKSDPAYSYNRMDDAIFNRYIENDNSQFHKMKSLLRSEEYLNRRYRDELLREKKDDRKYYPERINDQFIFHSRYERDIIIINSMITDGIVIKENEKLVINQSMKKTLEQFLEFLEKKQKIN